LQILDATDLWFDGARRPDERLPRLKKETMRRVTVRIVPFLMACYFIAFIDRVNGGLRGVADEQGRRPVGD